RPSDHPMERGSRRPKLINRLLEHSLIREVSFERYRRKVRDVYDGPQGALLAACSALSLHAPLGERLFQPGRFDLRGARRILDVGSGAGQLVRHLLKLADPNAGVTCVDLSPGMLRRARARLQSPRLQFLAADITQLPFADASFDCVTCGYVLEHLPDASLGLRELSRVMEPGARMLLLTTEDNMAGAWTSRMWCCRTYNRHALYGLCKDAGLRLQQELWFSPVHKALRAGGICIELVKE
ncbi:MAG: methyltransferase domain-containing protein, partial [Patescibacteria group bacterium]|nr:methyltransferase domain-containing protein [Patescibacteria group bacterium]